MPRNAISLTCSHTWPRAAHAQRREAGCTGQARLQRPDQLQAGVEELSKEKLTPLLRLKYHDSIADAVAELGRPDEIGRVFAGFQRYLYDKSATTIAGDLAGRTDS